MSKITTFIIYEVKKDGATTREEINNLERYIRDYGDKTITIRRVGVTSQ